MKIIPLSLPYGFVIFCDDIREEVRGKLTIVGVYGAEMTIFGAAPVVLPKLCVAIRFRDDPDTLPKKITFTITKETATETELLSETPLDAPSLPEEFEFPESIGSDGTKFIEIGFNAEITGLMFTDKTTIRVRAIIDEEEYRLGALTVKLTSQSQTTTT